MAWHRTYDAPLSGQWWTCVTRIQRGRLERVHYSDVIMSTMASQITGVSSVCSCVCSGVDKKTSKLRVTGLCEGNPPVTDGFPSQRASNTGNVFIWWRHHVTQEFHIANQRRSKFGSFVVSTRLHLPLDKMAAILADGIFKCIFLNETDRILIQISLKLVPKSSIDNKPTLIQVITWTNDYPLHWRIYAALGGELICYSFKGWISFLPISMEAIWWQKLRNVECPKIKERYVQ